MRTLALLPFPLLILIAAPVFAQNAQTTVDINVSTPKYSSGIVEARVTRKDPADKSVPAPAVTVRVTIAVRGEKPFFSKEISLKPGGAETVAAPFRGDGTAKAFTASAFAVGLKELAAQDNVRTSGASVIGTMTLPGTRPVPRTTPVISPRDPASKPSPNTPPAPAPAPAPAPGNPPPPNQQAAPAPAPAPAPASPPAAATITTTSLVLVGGAARTPAAAATGSTMTTSSIVLIGGAQRAAPAAPAGANITTSPIVLIGRRE